MLCRVDLLRPIVGRSVGWVVEARDPPNGAAHGHATGERVVQVRSRDRCKDQSLEAVACVGDQRCSMRARR